MKGKLIIIAGPSASGKTRLVGELLRRFPGSSRLLTTTTRPSRAEEKDGADYFFVSREEFERGIASGEFFEYAEVYGNLYGSSKGALKNALERYPYVFAIIDVQGAIAFRAQLTDSKVIFIRPGSLGDIERRLRQERPDMSKGELVRRLATASLEMQLAGTFDVTVDNIEGRFEETVREVVSHIQ